MSDDELSKEVAALVAKFGLPVVEPATLAVEAQVLARVPKDIAQQHSVLPIALTQDVLMLAMTNPLDIRAVDDVAFLTGVKKIEPVVCTPAAMRAALARFYP